MTTYWIAQVTVTDAEAYAGYQALARDVFAAHGGSFLARGGPAETLEGPAYARHVVIAFPDRQAALDCYNSEAYRAARAARAGAAEVQIVLVDGL